MMAEEKNPKNPKDLNVKKVSSSSKPKFDDIYDAINIDDVDKKISSDLSEKPKKKSIKKKPNINIKDSGHMIDGIWDLDAYIAKRKDTSSAKNMERPKEELNFLTQDDLDIRSLENIYAIVPNKKGDHKLVWKKDTAPEDLWEDDKWRSKGTVYVKNGKKIYDVALDFKRHATLKNQNDDRFDVWLIDEEKDLDNQLDAIKNGLGGGRNFEDPLIIDNHKKKTKKKSAPKSKDDSIKAAEIISLKAEKEAKKKIKDNSADKEKAKEGAIQKAKEEVKLKEAASAKAKADEDAKLKDEDAKLKDEAAAAKAKADEDAKLKEEAAAAKAKADEDAKLKEEAAAAKSKADEEAKLKEEAAAAKAKADEEAKLKEEAAAEKAKADEDAKLKEEAAAAKAKADEDAKLKEEADAKAKADEDARIKEGAVKAKAKADEEAKNNIDEPNSLWIDIGSLTDIEESPPKISSKTNTPKETKNNSIKAESSTSTSTNTLIDLDALTNLDETPSKKIKKPEIVVNEVVNEVVKENIKVESEQIKEPAASKVTKDIPAVEKYLATSNADISTDFFEDDDDDEEETSGAWKKRLIRLLGLVFLGVLIGLGRLLWKVMFADSNTRELDLDDISGEVVTIPGADSDDSQWSNNNNRWNDNDEVDTEQYDDLIALPNPNGDIDLWTDGELIELPEEVSEEYLITLRQTIRTLKKESRTLLNKSRLINNADALRFAIAAYSQANDLVEKLDENESQVTAEQLEKIIEKVRLYIKSVRDLIG